MIMKNATTHTKMFITMLNVKWTNWQSKSSSSLTIESLQLSVKSPNPNGSIVTCWRQHMQVSRVLAHTIHSSWVSSQDFFCATHMPYVYLHKKQISLGRLKKRYTRIVFFHLYLLMSFLGCRLSFFDLCITNSNQTMYLKMIRSIWSEIKQF